MSGIFISYRRDDTSYIAGRLHDRLSALFGPEQIFRDIDTIRLGMDFVDQIEEAVGSCDALVAIIGKDWLETKDRSGSRRLENPNDVVRLEIAAALSRGVLVIPVLVEDAKMPPESELPESIRKLSRRNALDLSDARWNYEVQKLIDELERVVERPGPVLDRAIREVANRPTTPLPSPPHAAPRPAVDAPVRPAQPDAARPIPHAPAWHPPTRVDDHSSRPSYDPAPRHAAIPAWLLPVRGVLGVVVLVVVVAIVLLVVNPFSRSGSDEDSTAVSGSTVPGPVTTASTAGPDVTAGPGGVQGPRLIVGPWSGQRKRLGPLDGQEGDFTLTVEKIEVLSGSMQVHMTVDNGLSRVVSLPASTFSAIDDLGHSYPPRQTYETDDWPYYYPAGTTRGFVVLTEGLQAGAHGMRVGWDSAAVGFDLFVEGIELS